MITANVLQRVFRILHDGMTASCYTIEKGDLQFIVSAAHIFKKSTDITELTIFHDGAWKKLPVKVVFNSLEPSGDTIVFKPTRDISPRHEIKHWPIDVVTGDWAYFLGFPLDVSAPGIAINNRYPIPFVKSGLVSNVNLERHGIITIYLDGHNNKGFSGGPVVYIDRKDQNKMAIIGTVSGYVTEPPISVATKEDVSEYRTNAGIVEAFWIKKSIRSDLIAT